jgi:hypothetical protein
MSTAHPVGRPSHADFKGRTISDVPKIAPISPAGAMELLGKIRKGTMPASLTQVLSLSARYPYSANGNMDVYEPGRWDTTYDLVFLDDIVDGPSAGEWTGSAVYASFTAPASATYLVVANFSGYQTTLNLGGPWGTNTAYTAATSDNGAAAALWTGNAGELLSFGVTMTGGLVGYLQSIQCFQT